MKSLLACGAALAGLSLYTLASAATIESSYGFLNYDGSAFPEASGTGLQVVSSAGTRQIINGSIFEIDTQTSNSDGQHRYTYSTQDSGGHLDRSGEGYVVEISLAIPSSERNMTTTGVNRVDAAFQLVIMDRDTATPEADTTTYYVGIDKLQVAVALDGVAAADTAHIGKLTGYNSAEQNVFTIHRKGKALNVLWNGTNVLSLNDFVGTSYPGAERSLIEFGDRSTSRDGKYQVNYLRAGGVTVPEPGAAAGGLFLLGSLAYRLRR